MSRRGQDVSSNKAVCTFFQEDRCTRGVLCRFLHVKVAGCAVPSSVSRVPCRFFRSPGGCSLGDSCRFQHVAEAAEAKKKEKCDTCAAEIVVEQQKKNKGRGRRPAVECHPCMAAKLKEQGNELFRQGSFAEASDLYTKAIRLSNETVFHLNRAASRLGEKKYTLALDDSLFVLSREPGNDKAILRAARAFRALGLLDEADAVLATSQREDAKELDIERNQVKECRDLVAQAMSLQPRAGLELLSLSKNHKENLLVVLCRVRLAFLINNMDMCFQVYADEFEKHAAERLLLKNDPIVQRAQLSVAASTFYATSKPAESVLDQISKLAKQFAGDEQLVDECNLWRHRIRTVITVVEEHKHKDILLAKLESLDVRLKGSVRLAHIYGVVILTAIQTDEHGHALKVAKELEIPSPGFYAKVVSAVFESLRESKKTEVILQLVTDAFCKISDAALWARAEARELKGDVAGAVSDFQALCSRQPQNSQFRRLLRKAKKLLSGESTGTHYSVLGVSVNATKDEIKLAFKKLALETHPDKCGGSAAAVARFRLVKEAFEVLRDDSKRRNYNQKLASGHYDSSSSSDEEEELFRRYYTRYYSRHEYDYDYDYDDSDSDEYY